MSGMRWGSALGHCARMGGLGFGFHFVAHFGGGAGQHAVMDGEQRQLEAVAHAGLVVDRAQVVLDHLLGGFEALRNLAVLASLHDQRHDAHFLGRQAIAHARAHHVFLD